MAKKKEPDMVQLANKDHYHQSYDGVWFAKGKGPMLTPEVAGVVLDKFSHLWAVVSGTPVMPSAEAEEPQKGGVE